MNVTGDPGLADIDRFMLKKSSKTGHTDLLFFDSKHLQSLTNKRTGHFLAPNTLRERFVGLMLQKIVLNLDETPPALERSLNAVTTLRRELSKDIEIESIPLIELSSLVEDIYAKTRKHHKILILTCENF